MNFIGTAAEDLTANSEWLLKRLPRLPCFAGYYPQISNALRFACQYENDPLGKFTHCEKTTKLKNISPFFEITLVTSKQNGLGQTSFYLLATKSPMRFASLVNMKTILLVC